MAYYLDWTAVMTLFKEIQSMIAMKKKFMENPNFVITG
jgi:hypothetical protein